jgi:hypothetical protein
MTAPRTHRLKTWPGPFRDVRSNAKTFEFRYDDRGFELGDVLELAEWDPSSGHYTGEEEKRSVTYILHGGRFGIPPGHCVMGIEAMDARIDWRLTAEGAIARETEFRDKVAGLEKENHALRFELGDVIGERDTAVNAQMAAASEALSLSQLVAEWRPVVESAKRYVHCAKSGTHTEAQRCGRRDCLVAAVTDFGAPPSVVPVEVAAGEKTARGPAPGSSVWGYGDSPNCENWCGAHDTREDAIGEGTDNYGGEPFYIQEGRWIDAVDFFDVDQLLERAGEMLYDNAPEDAEFQWPRTQQVAVEALAKLLKAWCAEHVRVSHWATRGEPELIEPKPEETPDQVVARLGIDVPKWAGEIRAKVAAALPNKEPQPAPSEGERCDAFRELKARQFAEVERDKAWRERNEAIARAESAESALAAARLELAAVGGDAAAMLRLCRWAAATGMRSVGFGPMGWFATESDSPVLAKSVVELASKLGLVDPPKVAKGDG